MKETVPEFLSNGVEKRVDYGSIEKSLADMWRGNGPDDEHAVTRAALWNVVAHTTNTANHEYASETLGKASAEVPQRAIIIRSEPDAAADMTAWIRANCHPVGGNKQVCSEEVAIVAGGDRVHRVPPLVRALLIPDMPVAVWWLGDLPNEHEAYVESLLEPADRLIVDSVHFDSAADLALVERVAECTTTAPADLNWVRLEEWRAAAASLFDPPTMRERLARIRSVRLLVDDSGSDLFGHMVEALYFAGWLSLRASHQVGEDGMATGATGSIDYRFESRDDTDEPGGLTHIELTFDDNSAASISRDLGAGILRATIDGDSNGLPDAVTRISARSIDQLIVRHLKRPESDRLLLASLPVARKLAARIKR